MHSLIKIGLGLSIAIVFPFMIAFGISAFYDEPKQAYEICRAVDPNNKIKPLEPQAMPIDPQNDKAYKACYDKAQAELDIYNRNLFLLTTAFGFMAIVIGTLLFSERLGPVGPGLVFGGLFTILYGTMRSFSSLDKQWLFIELVVVFIGIILVTWRYLRSISPKPHKKNSLVSSCDRQFITFMLFNRFLYLFRW